MFRLSVLIRGPADEAMAHLAGVLDQLNLSIPK